MSAAPGAATAARCGSRTASCTARGGWRTTAASRWRSASPRSSASTRRACGPMRPTWCWCGRSCEQATDCRVFLDASFPDSMSAEEDPLVPLRDHFRPPLDDLRHWEGFHATWPVMIVALLRRKLPRRYFAEPRVHSGSTAEIAAVTDLPAQDIYEVLVYDEQCHCRLVAAVEIVSPANKDRPEHRRTFVAKCAGLLRERVSVVLVDVVTTSTQNLYGELLDLIGQSDPGLNPEPPPLYTAACRLTRRAGEWMLETWVQHLALGRPLPTVPLWLADD